MKLIHTNDGEHYRRWVNLIPTIFLPGSAQFLAGRRIAGIAWFVSYLFLGVLLIGYWVHPKTNVSILAMGSSEWVVYPFFWLAVALGSNLNFQQIKQQTVVINRHLPDVRRG